jgi:hypothetical protein
VFHALEIGFGLLEDQFGVDDGCLAEVGVYCCLDVFRGVVEMDKDCVDDVIEGRLGELDVPTAEENVNGCGYLEANGILAVVQSLQQHRVELLQLFVSNLLPKFIQNYLVASRYFSSSSHEANLSSGAQSSLRQFLRCGTISLKQSSSCSWLMMPRSIRLMMLMTPAFLILI